MVLPAYSPELLRGHHRRDDLVAEYFNQGYTNNEIVFALLSTHGVHQPRNPEDNFAAPRTKEAPQYHVCDSRYNWSNLRYTRI